MIEKGKKRKQDSVSKITCSFKFDILSGRIKELKVIREFKSVYKDYYFLIFATNSHNVKQ